MAARTLDAQERLSAVSSSWAVRGVYQLGRFRFPSKAQGFGLSRRETEFAYGPEIVAEITEPDAVGAVILSSVGAVERAFSTVRSVLRVEQAEVAEFLDVPEQVVVEWETDQDLLWRERRFRSLADPAFRLGLDPLMVGWVPDGAKPSTYRVLEAIGCHGSDVLPLAEIVSRTRTCGRLMNWLGRSSAGPVGSGVVGASGWETGLRLAEKVRFRFGLGSGPVLGLRNWVEQVLGVPVFYRHLSAAGSVVVRVGDRVGVVVNTDVPGEGRAVRRARLAYATGRVLAGLGSSVLVVGAREPSSDLQESVGWGFAAGLLVPRAEVWGLPTNPGFGAVVGLAARFGVPAELLGYDIGVAHTPGFGVPQNVGVDRTGDRVPGRSGLYRNVLSEAYQRGWVSADSFRTYILERPTF